MDGRTFISTRPPVGGKKVKRKVGVLPKKKKSAFKKRAAKEGKIIFDNPQARAARLRSKTTRQLLQEAQNNAANEVGRQDGGFAMGRQAPIAINLGQAGAIDDRVAEVRRRMDVANLINPQNPAPQQPEVRQPRRPPTEVGEPARRVNPLRELRDELSESAETIVEPTPPRRPPTEVGEVPPPPTPFGGISPVAADDGAGVGLQPAAEPEVELQGETGDAASIVDIPLGADAFNLADLEARRNELGFTPPPSSVGLSRVGGFDPTFDEAEDRRLRTPPPLELPSFGSNPVASDEETRQRGGVVGAGRAALARAGGSLARLLSRGGSDEPAPEEPFANPQNNPNYVFQQNPFNFEAGSVAGSSVGFDATSEIAQD